MARSSKDLFDDSTMSFGEHLEVLRVHLWKALIGVVVAVVFTLFQGSAIIGIVRKPIDDALSDYRQVQVEDDAEQLQEIDFWDRVTGYLKDQFSLEVLTGRDESDASASQAEPAGAAGSKAPAAKKERGADTIRVKVNAGELGKALHQLNPQAYPPPPQTADEEVIHLDLSAPQFAEFEQTIERIHQVVALNVQEPFMTYLKVSIISGLVLASPWVFYQLWLFVAAGLFPHERKYVYVYGTVSGVLFLVGVVFCFYLVFPFVLRFLLGFNAVLGVHPQIRLSEWISFAVTLPLLFGVSFQLPLVMLFLERLSIFSVTDFQEKRRMAILVISIISMVLTPAEPVSMLMMMFPLILLYELGIILCRMSPAAGPFEGELTTA